MRLLVTRPMPDAERTAGRLRALGHDAVVQPLLQIEFLPPAKIAEPAAIAVTSRNGARGLAAWPGAIGWRGLPLFAVGSATAEVAAAAGFEDIRSADGDGLALAKLIEGSFDRAAGRILYPAAEVRSGTMEEALEAAGFAIDVVIAYRMAQAAGLETLAVEAIRSGTLDGVLIYSKRSASAFVELAQKAGLTASLQGLAVFVLSSTVAEQFSRIEVGELIVADTPNEEGMMRAIGATERRDTGVGTDGER